MVLPAEVIWEADPHTLAKHAILRRYLGAWFPILASWNGRIIYLDGFSGPGEYKGGEKGSPLVALDVALNQYNPIRNEVIFWFIEENGDRFANLEKCLDAYSLPSNFKPLPICGSFPDVVGPILDEIESAGTLLPPTFAFIDPFGFSDMPQAVVSRILVNKSCEVFVALMADAINRFFEHPNEEIAKHIKITMGVRFVERILAEAEKGNRLRLIIESYCEMLREHAEYVRTFEMRDQDDRIIYFLVFASNHPLGFSKMKHAMRAVAGEQSMYSFSDANLPNQTVLFPSDELAAAALRPFLIAKYNGVGVVTGKEITDFVEYKTDFIAKDKTACLKQLLAEGLVVVEPIRADGSPYKKQHQFGDLVRLSICQQ